MSESAPIEPIRLGTFRSLRHRNYRLFFISSTVTNVGTWVQRIAQDWLVLQLTHSGTDLGLVTGLQFLPALFLSLQGGAIADRFDKRKVLVLTNFAGGIFALMLGLLAYFGTVHRWHVYALAFALGIASAIDAPVRQSFVAEMVGPADLPNAVSLNSANFNAGRLIGPALSGVLITAFGTGPSFLINAASFFVIIGALLMMNTDELLQRELKDQKKVTIRDGIRYVRERTDLKAVIFVVGLMATFGLNFQITTALMATHVFHLGPSEFGLLSASVALGSLVGALVAARLERAPTAAFVLWSALVFGIFETIASVMPTFLTFALMLPFCGAMILTTLIAANSTMQLRSTPENRGRVMGIYLMIFLGGTPIGSPAIGWIAQTFGPRFSIGIGGVISMLAALIALIVTRGKLEVSDY
ncbi:enterobactin exporter EntS [mine drainage metagenome]|uniref:Enterobactin exporter EntS n=1 Tax=mine drainage metagenome TaxID=410659 RepID=A0A1J5PT10_9ZZZZ